MYLLAIMIVTVVYFLEIKLNKRAQVIIKENLDPNLKKEINVIIIIKKGTRKVNYEKLKGKRQFVTSFGTYNVASIVDNSGSNGKIIISISVNSLGDV